MFVNFRINYDPFLNIPNKHSENLRLKISLVVKSLESAVRLHSIKNRFVTRSHPENNCPLYFSQKSWQDHVGIYHPQRAKFPTKLINTVPYLNTFNTNCKSLNKENTIKSVMKSVMEA